MFRVRSFGYHESIACFSSELSSARLVTLFKCSYQNDGLDESCTVALCSKISNAMQIFSFDYLFRECVRTFLANAAFLNV